MSQPEYCNPRCQSFKCANRALIPKKELLWCRYADDNCDAKTCKFAQCLRGKLLPNGVCGLSVKQRTVNLKLSDLDQPVKVSGKLAQKLRERELF